MARKRNSDWSIKDTPVEAETQCCWLCERPLGERIEWHHPIPKSRKGRETVAVHPICHRTLHANFNNKELAAIGIDAEKLRSEARLHVFLKWIADKPIDFHAETHQSKGSPERWKEKGRG